MDAREGMIVFAVGGDTAVSTFANESGGHRFQRVPPTEKAGRVQTSTITVAVLADVAECDFELKDSDLRFATTRGSGPGGQNRNKVESCVILTHSPTGLSVRCETERSQFRNRQLALALLRSRLFDQQQRAANASVASDRKAQIGSGMRGDKRRTIRVRDNQVKDHVTGQSWRWTDYSEGKW